MNESIQHQSATVLLSRVEIEIINVLLYFDLFEFPLRASEIVKNFSFKIDIEECQRGLKDLVQNSYIEQSKDYYHVPGKTTNVKRRLDGAELAKKFMPKAQRISRFIARRAFVKAVFISGSLSKGYMESGSDIDYFIITSKNRVWFVKGWLTLVKKVLLLNSKKYFCLNYFVDDQHLMIEERNEFTAKEINYLIPTYNQESYAKFLSENKWSQAALPNFNVVHKNVSVFEGRSFWKRFNEKLWSGKLGDWLDTMSMKSFEKYWRRKYKRQFKVNEGIQIKCQKHISKIHPGNFQDRVLTGLEEKRQEFEKRYGVKLKP